MRLHFIKKTVLGSFLCVLLACCLAALAGCTAGTGKSSAPAADSIKIATLSQSISFYEKGNDTLGYEYEMAKAFARAQGLSPVFVLAKDVNELVTLTERGEVDIAAYPIVVSNKYKGKNLVYTSKTYVTRQVLVQRQGKKEAQAARKKGGKTKKKAHRRQESKPADLTKDVTPLVEDVTELIGKEVWVPLGSKYEERLKHLNEEIGGGINIKTTKEDDEEDLIDKVYKGEIDFTICDEDIALANATDYPDLHIHMPVSFPQRAAWIANDDSMAEKVNRWIETENGKKTATAAFDKYFTRKHFITPPRQRSRLEKLPKGEISAYDDLFRKYASANGLDWKWIAAVAYQESRFNPRVIGWSGSVGLMQLMPATARKYGAQTRDELFDPETNIRIACQLFKTLEGYFKMKSKDQRMKFMLAAYNAGIGHVRDAQALARKHGKDPNVWENNVEPFIRLKSNREYYNDPVVKHGYLHGNIVSNYVASITDYHKIYMHIKVNKTKQGAETEEDKDESEKENHSAVTPFVADSASSD